MVFEIVFNPSGFINDMILCLMLTVVRKMIFFYDTWAHIMLHYSISSSLLSFLAFHIFSVPLYLDAGHNIFARFKVFMATIRARTPRLDITRCTMYCCRKIGVKLQLLIAVNKLHRTPPASRSRVICL